MPKIVVISDTHNRHGSLDLPSGDILVHCGDCTGRGTLLEVIAFLDWFDKQKFTHKIMIAGNHDWLFENEPNYSKILLKTYKITYLQDSSIELEGIKFYGSPWQPWFYDWAFNLGRGDELEKKWNLIPKDTDFLITHGPPFGILDRTKEGDLVGCLDLLKAVEKIKPKVHAFGHIHESYGMEQYKNTIFINASICTRTYIPSQKPIVIEY